MLTRSSAVIGSNLGEVLLESGIYIVPKVNTLISELNKAILNNKSLYNFSDKAYIPECLIYSSTGEETIVKGVKNYVNSPHDSFMDNYIEDMSKLVTNYISFARSVVNTEVTLLKEDLQNTLNSYKFKEPEYFFNLTYFKPHEVFSSYIITTEIMDYKESQKKYFFESINLNAILQPDFNIVKYILVGEEEQDTLIQSWLSTLSNELIKNYITENIIQYNLGTPELLNYALINYLFYRNLYERTDIESGLSESFLKAKCLSNKEYFANLVYISLEQYKKDIRNGLIISSDSQVTFSFLNDEPLNITIYDENLYKLSEAGLSIEVLFGYISTGLGSVSVTVDDLIAHSEEYSHKWYNTRTLYTISLNNSRLSIFKQILRDRFEKSLTRSDINKDEEEYLKDNNSFKEETIKLANEYMDNLSIKDIDDLYNISLELVANIRFRFTNSYYILKQMNEILKLDDKVQPLEAALFASINYITDYLLEQIDTVRV